MGCFAFCAALAVIVFAVYKTCDGLVTQRLREACDKELPTGSPYPQPVCPPRSTRGSTGRSTTARGRLRAVPDQTAEDAVSALTNLGIRAAEARNLVAQARKVNQTGDVAELIKEAMRKK